MINVVLSEKNAIELININKLDGHQPEVSIIVPVFNQEAVINQHLQAIVNCAELKFEMIVIDDASNDSTKTEIVNFISMLDKNKSKEKYAIQYYRNRYAWFETRCDDFGIRKAAAPIVIEIQADMLIKEKGFDRRLRDVLSKDEKLFAVSARAGHALSLIQDIGFAKTGTDISDQILRFRIFKRIKFKILKHLKTPESILEIRVDIPRQESSESKLDKVFPKLESNYTSAGWMSEFIELLPYEGDNIYTETLKNNLDTVWKCETINRGPLALKRDIYLELGGFNVHAFYQGNDDHDLCVRAAKRGYSVGFSPINFASPMSLGNARRKRTLRQKIWSKTNRRLREKNLRKSALVQVQANNKV
ncbi:MAG: glycosyltransferase [Bacteroidetes bacterium]|nr:glycosyltransferase [bacterium]NBP64865.1 glycosyltransferase [Bacteroidota bacterium]